MDLHLDGRRALVTGSSSGLGAEIARHLAAEGAEVVVHGRDACRAGAVAQEIVDAGGRSAVAVGDLATDDGAEVVANTALAGGPIDILVNNAGVYDVSKGWFTTSAKDWADFYNLNVISAVRLVQRLVPGMRERGWGRVIQIGSVTGDLPQPSQPHYAASNAARANLAVSLARELKHSGVTSNVVVAGAMLVPAVEERLTEIGRQNGWGSTFDEVEHRVVSSLAPNDVGRVGRLHEYASLVAYLAGEDAAFVNGTTLRVDGGWRDA